MRLSRFMGPCSMRIHYTRLRRLRELHQFKRPMHGVEAVIKLDSLFTKFVHENLVILGPKSAYLFLRNMLVLRNLAVKHDQIRINPGDLEKSHSSPLAMRTAMRVA